MDEISAKWSEKPLEHIGGLQAKGLVRPELDREEVRRRLFSAVYAAVLALLADPSPEEEARQLAAIDRLLEEIAADDEVGA
ncbi:MAG: hypothetical protein ACR2PQ_04680 [Myxococcota bacterium]